MYELEKLLIVVNDYLALGSETINSTHRRYDGGRAASSSYINILLMGKACIVKAK